MSTFSSSVQAENGVEDIRGVILDLDGVVYRGETLIPGAAEFLAFLERTDRRVVALTNHAGAVAGSYAQKLAGFGITLPEERILTSAWATARYLQNQAPGAGFYALGSQALRASLLAAGLVASSTPDYVVVGFDAELNFASLAEATKHLLAGAQLIGCNPDALLPTQAGPVPECGPILAFLERASVKKATVIGKPNPWIVQLALERLGLSRHEVLMVGDTLETDIAGGSAAGVRTALVLTGNTTEARGHEATVVAKDLHELVAVLARGKDDGEGLTLP